VSGPGHAGAAIGGPRPEDRLESQWWARRLLQRVDWVILDTETTGLDHGAEVIQLGVVGPDGRTLLDTLLQPGSRIPVDATRIHGITDAMVVGAPRFGEVRDRLQGLVQGKMVVSYNAAFDQRLLVQTAVRHRVPVVNAAWECAMRHYSRFVGRWSTRHGGYSWQQLPRTGAYAHQSHQAIGDCLATLQVIQRMAGR
jgi:DNA polymerase-3 subunit epsilon